MTFTLKVANSVRTIAIRFSISDSLFSLRVYRVYFGGPTRSLRSRDTYIRSLIENRISLPRSGLHRRGDVFLRLHRLRHNSYHRRGGDESEEEHPPRHSLVIDHNSRRLRHQQHGPDADR